MPWKELKQAELRVLDESIKGAPSATSVADLKRRLAAVADDTDAAEAICYYGARSLAYEQDGDLLQAIHHREIEIAKIEYLHELAQKNPGDAAALDNYRVADLGLRRDILARLKEST